MNIIDIIILLGLLSGGSYGFKNGFVKTAVILLGTILCFVIAYFLKNPIADFLSYNLPFFNFNGLTALNIVIYQFIAFGLVLVVLSFLLVFVISISGGIEKIFKMTIVLGIPSKILGFILGILEALVIAFILLFIVRGFCINKEINILEDSKFAPIILESVPGISNIAEGLNDTINDVIDITKTCDSIDNKKCNNEIIRSLKEHKIVNDNYLNKLREKGKI